MRGLRVALAFASVYLFWGASYLCLRFAIESIPPLLMAGSRHFVAGSVLFLFQRKLLSQVTRGEVLSGMLIGALTLGMGNGAVAYAQLTFPSAFAALLVTATPLFMVVMNWFWFDRIRPLLSDWIGLAIGMWGTGLLVTHGKTLSGEALPVATLMVVTVGTLAWSLGSLLGKKLKTSPHLFLNVAFQMLGGGILLVSAALLKGDLGTVVEHGVSSRSLWGFAYLVVFASIIAYSSYIWLLKVCDTKLVTTYSFVNPVIAMALGTWIAGEEFSEYALWGAAASVAGVALVVTKPRFLAR